MRLFRFSSGVIFIALLSMLVSSCDAIDSFPSTLVHKSTDTPTPGPSATLTFQPVSSQPGSQAATPGASRIFTIWLPPDLNPNGTSAASKLMAQRLNAFEQQNTDFKLNIRIKNLAGPEGMLNTLSITRDAAPLAMPSIIVLPQPDLETAVRKNLVYPVDSLPAIKNQADWYPYSQAMARVDQKWYGAPFSGDALILLYRGPQIIPSGTWDSILKSNQPVLFPAADPDALLPLSLYESLAGEIKAGSSPQPLQENELVKLFTFFQNAAHEGIFSFSLSQYERYDQTWAAFAINQSHYVVTWASTYITSGEPEDQPAPLPGLANGPYTLATGSMFAISASDPERQAVGLKLIDFLLEPGFLAQLNRATGSLPTRVSANSYPSDPRKQAFFDQVCKSAHVQPVLPDSISLYGRVKEATIQVIRYQVTPQEAANAVLNRPKSP